MAETSSAGSELLLELFSASGEGGAERYRERRARSLLSGGQAACASLFALREQHVPEAPLAAAFHAGLFALNPGADPPEAPRPIDGVSLLGSATYGPMAVCGEPSRAGEARPSAMLVLSHPTDLGHDTEFNAWYTDNHMIDVARSPHFGSSARYAPRRQLAGTPLPYLCVYEIEKPYSAELHRGLMHWQMETPDDFRQPMPRTSAGQEVLTIDLWAYFERLWSEGR